MLSEGCGISKNIIESKWSSNILENDLSNAGFVSNEEKSVWAPWQTIIWLGFVWNSGNGTFAISEIRLENISAAIDSIIDLDFVVSARHFASFTLYMSDYFNRLDHRKYIAIILKSHCVMSTMCTQHGDALVELDQYSKEEIVFWRNNVSSVKSWHCFLTKTPQIFAYSDASATGCRSIVSLDNEPICHRLWDQSETSKNSTWRELAATDFGIESFGPIFECTRVKLFTVNQAAAKILEIGRMRINIHILAMSIFNVALNDS